MAGLVVFYADTGAYGIGKMRQSIRRKAKSSDLTLHEVLLDYNAEESASDLDGVLRPLDILDRSAHDEAYRLAYEWQQAMPAQTLSDGTPIAGLFTLPGSNVATYGTWMTRFAPSVQARRAVISLVSKAVQDFEAVQACVIGAPDQRYWVRELAERTLQARGLEPLDEAELFTEEIAAGYRVEVKSTLNRVKDRRDEFTAETRRRVERSMQSIEKRREAAQEVAKVSVTALQSALQYIDRDIDRLGEGAVTSPTAARSRVVAKQAKRLTEELDSTLDISDARTLSKRARDMSARIRGLRSELVQERRDQKVHHQSNRNAPRMREQLHQRLDVLESRIINFTIRVDRLQQSSSLPPAERGRYEAFLETQRERLSALRDSAASNPDVQQIREMIAQIADITAHINMATGQIGRDAPLSIEKQNRTEGQNS